MEEVIDYLTKLPEDKWQTKVNPTWNINNVVAHLIAWNYEAAKEIELSFKEVRQPWFLGYGDFDDFNAKAVEKYKKFSKEELLEELKKSDIAVDIAIEKCGREKLKETPGFKWLFDTDRKPHSVQHLDKIKEALSNE